MQRWKWSLCVILILAVTGIIGQAQEKEAPLSATEIMQKKVESH